MTLNENFINYKVLDLVILHNFDIKFDFIWDHTKKFCIFLHRTICRERAMPSPTHKKYFLGTVDAITRP